MYCNRNAKIFVVHLHCDMLFPICANDSLKVYGAQAFGFMV